MPPVEPSLQMWLTLALTAAAVVVYAAELLPVELTALGILGGLLLLFQALPLVDAGGASLIGPAELLAGFSSPALIAVSALLVVGEAIVSTGALEGIARLLVWMARGSFLRALTYSLGYVTASSAVPEQHADRRDLHADPALDRRALRPAAECGADAAQLRRHPGRHADPDRDLDQPSGLGRARQARRAAVRLFRLHAAGAGAGAGGRLLRAAAAAPATAARRTAGPGRGRRQAVHRRARRRAGLAADRRDRARRHVPEPGRRHGAPGPARRAGGAAAVRGASRSRPATS